LIVELSPAAQKQAEADARNDGLIQDAIERAKRDGPVPEVLSSDQQITTTYDRLAEQQAFRASTKQSLIPLAVRVGPEYPGGFNWVLSDADYDSVLAGAYCGFCLVRHEELWQPACSTCGADRDVVTRHY
jgi:hypothetical protein